MKKLYGALCALTLAAVVPMCAADEAKPAAEKSAPAVTAPAAAPAPAAAMSDKEKIGYSIGVNIGMQWNMRLKTLDLDVNMDTLVRGFRDAMSNHKLELSEEDMRATLDKLQTEIEVKRQEHVKEMTALGDKFKVEGPKFLEENKKKEGVKVLPSGLQYKVLKEGEGQLPGPTDIVTVNYRGMFTDGKEFDSSAKHGMPLQVPLDEKKVIPGLTDALKMMKVGAKWMVFIPSDLGYGETGGGSIPPNAVLVFEVEVLGIKQRASEGMPVK